MSDGDRLGDVERRRDEDVDRAGQLAEVLERLVDVVAALVEEVGRSPARERAFNGAALTRNLQEAKRILRQGR